MRIAAFVFALLALPLAGPVRAAPSVGEPVVYYSTDPMGAPPASLPVVLPRVDDQMLDLYIDYENDPDVGASSGSMTMCVDETGDETCGFDVLIELTSDGASFGSFVPASPDIVYHIEPGTPATPTEPAIPATLRVNGIDLAPPSSPVYYPIGTLELDAANANEFQLVVKGMHRVGAAGQLDTIQERVIAMPEPGLLWQLGCGLAGLAGLVRRRRRRTPIP